MILETKLLWLLDTCVISELTRPQPAARVTQWLAGNAKQCALAAVSVGEIQYGLASLEAGSKKRRLQTWFDDLCSQFASRILPTDTPVWLEFGVLKQQLEALGRRQDDLDMLIAATAHCHRLSLVTRNTRHFQDTGLVLIDPWKTA